MKCFIVVFCLLWNCAVLGQVGNSWAGNWNGKYILEVEFPDQNGNQYASIYINTIHVRMKCVATDSYLDCNVVKIDTFVDPESHAFKLNRQIFFKRSGQRDIQSDATEILPAEKDERYTFKHGVYAGAGLDVNAQLLNGQLHLEIQDGAERHRLSSSNMVEQPARMSWVYSDLRASFPNSKWKMAHIEAWDGASGTIILFTDSDSITIPQKGWDPTRQENETALYYTDYSSKKKEQVGLRYLNGNWTAKYWSGDTEAKAIKLNVIAYSIPNHTLTVQFPISREIYKLALFPTRMYSIGKDGKVQLFKWYP